MCVNLSISCLSVYPTTFLIISSVRPFLIRPSSVFPAIYWYRFKREPRKNFIKRIKSNFYLFLSCIIKTKKFFLFMGGGSNLYTLRQSGHVTICWYRQKDGQTYIHGGWTQRPIVFCWFGLSYSFRSWLFLNYKVYFNHPFLPCRTNLL